MINLTLEVFSAIFIVVIPDAPTVTVSEVALE